MINKLRKWCSSIFEAAGLDWLPIVVWDRFYKPHETKNPQLVESFDKHSLFLSLEETKDTVNELSDLLQNEEKRQDKIEAKAFSLISFTGLSSAFVAALTAVLGNSQYSPIFRIGIIILYTLLLVSLFITVMLATKAIRVGKYMFARPLENTIWDRIDVTEIGYHRRKGRNLLISYIYNQAVINDKASFVSGAQDWFRNTIILLIFIIGFSVFTSLGSMNTSASIPSLPTATSTPLPTETATFIFTLTPTSVSIPSATP